MLLSASVVAVEQMEVNDPAKMSERQREGDW